MLGSMKNIFPYTVGIKMRDNQIYGYVSFELPTPNITITKSNGVIGIDTNVSRLHLAIAEVLNDGNLISYLKINLHDFLFYNKNRKEYEEWILAHKIVD
jgi:hypothetical protein